jgi:hypothetical protein
VITTDCILLIAEEKQSMLGLSNLTEESLPSARTRVLSAGQDGLARRRIVLAD